MTLAELVRELLDIMDHYGNQEIRVVDMAGRLVEVPGVSGELISSLVGGTLQQVLLLKMKQTDIEERLKCQK